MTFGCVPWPPCSCQAARACAQERRSALAAQVRCALSALESQLALESGSATVEEAYERVELRVLGHLAAHAAVDLQTGVVHLVAAPGLSPHYRSGRVNLRGLEAQLNSASPISLAACLLPLVRAGLLEVATCALESSAALAPLPWLPAPWTDGDLAKCWQVAEDGDLVALLLAHAEGPEMLFTAAVARKPGGLKSRAQSGMRCALPPSLEFAAPKRRRHVCEDSRAASAAETALAHAVALAPVLLFAEAAPALAGTVSVSERCFYSACSAVVSKTTHSWCLVVPNVKCPQSLTSQVLEASSGDGAVVCRLALGCLTVELAGPELSPSAAAAVVTSMLARALPHIESQSWLEARDTLMRWACPVE